MGDSLAALAGLGIEPEVQARSKMIYNFPVSCRQQQIFLPVPLFKIPGSKACIPPLVPRVTESQQK